MVNIMIDTDLMNEILNELNQDVSKVNKDTNKLFLYSLAMNIAMTLNDYCILLTNQQLKMLETNLDIVNSFIKNQTP